MKRILLLSALLIALLAGCQKAKYSLDDMNKAQPKCFIYYTTTNGQPIQLERNIFGEKIAILSNTYIDGQGTLSLSAKIRVLEGKVFNRCSTLKSITLPNGITEIQPYAFYYCTSLQNVDIPSGIDTFSSDAFEGCNSLATFGGEGASSDKRSIIIDGELVVFIHKNLTKYSTPEGVTTIGKDTFSGCTTLEEIVISEGVTTIEAEAFEGCTSLTTITLPESLEEFGAGVFSNCTGEVTINGVIPSHYNYTTSLFEGCKFSKITISNNVTKVGEAAFYGCTGHLVINNKIIEQDISYSSATHNNGHWLYGSNFDSITIGSKPTKIGSNALCSYSAATHITIPANIVTIGNDALRDCGGKLSIDSKAIETGYGSTPSRYERPLFGGLFTDITIGNNITKIGNYTFYNLTNLASITMSDNLTEIGHYAFYNTHLSEIVIPKGVKSIGDYAFSHCTSLTNITLNEGITSIGFGAFSYCDQLSSIIIPDTVAEIGDVAFSNCYELRDVTIGRGVTTIGRQAFSGCAGQLTINGPIIEQDYDMATSTAQNYEHWLRGSLFSSITIGGNALKIGNYAFYGYPNLTNLILQDNISEIGTYAFAETSITDVVIPDNVRTIGISAFDRCHSLKNLTLGRGLSTIDKYAFTYCTALTNIYIPDSVSQIGAYAFSQCSAVEEIYIGKGVRTIGGLAFSSCKGHLTINSPIIGLDYDGSTTTSNTSHWLYGSAFSSITLGDEVTAIGDYAFGEYNSLKVLTMRNVRTLGENIFFNCGGELTINGSIPYFTYGQGGSFLQGSSYTTLTIGDNVTSISGFAFKDCASIRNLNIGSNVESIGESAFDGCTSLEKVNIPAAVTSIGNFTFARCTALKEVVMSDSVQEIGYNAFYGCSSLANVSLSNSLTTIDSNTFFGCTSLQSITLPDSIQEIGGYAFYGTGLTSITIPKMVTSIENYAFSHCTSLASVYCRPTTPPSLFGSAFEQNATDRKFYVPSQYIELYKSSWSLFSSSIVAYDF